MTLGELVQRKSEGPGGNNTAFIQPAENARSYQTLAYKQFNDRTNKLANFLLSKGIKKGQRVSILLPNSIDFIIAYFAVFKIGAIALPLNSMLTLDELVFILQDSKASALIASEAFKDAADGLLTRVDSINFRWDVEKLAKECFEKGDASQPEVSCSEDDVAIAMYTSGTTGSPKGVMLTHKNLIYNVEACLRRIKITRKDKFSCLLPLFHSFTFTTCVLAPVYAGAASVVIKSLHSFKDVFRQLLKSRVSILIAVPSVYRVLTEAKVPFFLTMFPFRFLNPIRLCIAGGEALSPHVLKDFERKFHIPLLEGYGLTETSPVVSLSPPSRRKPGSVGKPLYGVDVKIADDKGDELPAGRIGEILVKGPSVMKGYYDREEETKEAVKDGWLYTGDLGRMDEEGFIYIVDRKKDLIIVKGMNIYPKEVEDVLYSYPKIKEAAVIGKKLGEKGEIPVAYVVLKEGAQTTEEEIHKYLKHSLSLYKIPRSIEFRKSLPKSPTGKILKRRLV